MRRRNSSWRIQADAEAQSEAEAAENARAELIAQVEELRAYARRAFAELKAERAENRRLAELRFLI